MADRIKGLDVSDHQADWKPSPSYHFVFIKATEGQSWKAQKAAQHARRARDAGYVVGWYHFLWPSAKSGNPSTQAMWFLNNIPDLRVGDLLVCDWEPTKGGTPTRSDKNLFMAAVKKARGNRNKVGLYLNASMWNSSDKKAGDFLWVARYGAGRDSQGERERCHQGPAHQKASYCDRYRPQAEREHHLQRRGTEEPAAPGGGAHQLADRGGRRVRGPGLEGMTR
jgi:GH25 family lysozyme M1 (1,4-beta-N-acetylmuramidase)